jgi:WD40 repeat protein/serine/threonine protein kinase
MMIVPENAVTTGDQTGADASLADWVEELADRIQAGEAVDLDAYTREFPERAEELRRLLPTIEMMASFGKSPVADATSSHWCGLASREPVGQDGPLGTLGDFQILREVGRGAMGIVYEAAQESLGRHVALKVMVDNRLRDPRRLERFQREAKAAARLHHTNIVPVFGVGQADGVHYYVMQLIRGLGLDRVLEEVRRLRGQPNSPGSATDSSASEMARSLVAGTLAGTVESAAATPADAGWTTGPMLGSSSSSVTLPGQADVDLSAATSSAGRYVRSVARIGLQVAEALAYAHEQGVLHRDIKPANLLLDGRGNVWLADFGLAKHADGDLTHTGDVVGTLRYMAPERFEGRCDARSDVYSLGLTIYELLATQPAFAAADRNVLIREVTQAEPKRLRALERSIPRDLETIVHKAIEKDPAHRYPTAAALAEDFRRFLEDGPIAARRTGPAERLLRWGRRNPSLAGLTAAVFLLLSTIAVLASVNSVRIEKQAEQARAETVRANQALGAAERARNEVEEANVQLRAAREAQRRTLYAARMHLARAAWDADNVGRVVRLLDLQRPEQGQTDLRGWEWQYLSHRAHSALHTIPLQTRMARTVAFSPDGSRLLIAGGITHEAGKVAIWDVNGNREVLSWKVGGGPVLAATLSRDGTRIAAACWGYVDAEQKEVVGRVEVWDAATGTPLLTIKEDLELVLGVAFSPDGKRIAAVQGSQQRSRREVKVWDAATGQRQLSIDVSGPVGYDNDIVFSPDGTRIASGGFGLEGEVKVWDAADGRALLSLKGHATPVSSLAYSPDGQRIATACWDATVRIWDAASGREELKLRGKGPKFIGVAFSPDGSRVAGAGVSRLVTVWDAHDGRTLGTLKGHFAGVTSVDFSPDGRRLASGDYDGTVKIWEGLPQHDPRILGEAGDSAALLAYRPDGQVIATGAQRTIGAPGIVTLRRVADGQIERSFEAHARGIEALRYSPDGTRLATAGRNRRLRGEARIWDAASGRELATLGPELGAVHDLAFSPDGRSIVTAAAADARSQEVAAVKIWDVANGREIRTLEGIPAGVVKVAYSGDGRWLATAENGDVQGTRTGRLRLWEAETGRQVRMIETPSGMVGALAISPDSTRIAVAVDYINGESVPVKVWEIATGREWFEFEGHSGSVTGLAFSPDGARIATSSLDGMVKLWDATEGEELFTLSAGTDGKVLLDVAFSPDGTCLCVGGKEIPLTIWEAGPRRD